MKNAIAHIGGTSKEDIMVLPDMSNDTKGQQNNNGDTAGMDPQN